MSVLTFSPLFSLVTDSPLLAPLCHVLCVGSWSNIVAELLAQDVSDELLALAVTPLHTRVR